MPSESPTELDDLRRRIAKLDDGFATNTGRDIELALGLLDTARVIVAVLDHNGCIVFVNRYFERVTGHTLAELEGRDWFDTLVPSEDTGRVRGVFARAMAGAPTVGNINAVLTRDARSVLVEWYDRPLVNVRGETTGMLSIGHDVTTRVLAAEELHALNLDLEARIARRTARLRESIQLLEATFDATAVGLAYLDAEFNFVRVNRRYASFDAKQPADFHGKNHFDLYPNKENRAIFTRVRDTGVPHKATARPFEYAHNEERGVSYWDWTLTPIKDGDGTVIGLVLALLDVSPRIRALEQQTTLLRELHHRVKNNLQLVESLLSLQASNVKDPTLSTLLRESRDRIRAMGLVHETLHQSENVSRVKLDAYVNALTTSIARTQANNGIQVTTDVGVPYLETDQAVPCGLIINELVNNALRHAFVDRDTGSVHVSVTQSSDQRVELRVADDGVGIARDALEQPTSLGLRLVKALAGQLDASVELHAGTGATFVIEFSLE